MGNTNQIPMSKEMDVRNHPDNNVSDQWQKITPNAQGGYDTQIGNKIYNSPDLNINNWKSIKEGKKNGS